MIIFSRNIFDAHFDCGHFENFTSSKFPQDIFGKSGRNFDDTKLLECPQSKCASKIFRENIILEMFDAFSTLKFVGARSRQFLPGAGNSPLPYQIRVFQQQINKTIFNDVLLINKRQNRKLMNSQMLRTCPCFFAFMATLLIAALCLSSSVECRNGCGSTLRSC